MVSSFYSATEILTHCSAAAAANTATRPPARTHKNIISLLAQCSLAAGGGWWRADAENLWTNIFAARTRLKSAQYLLHQSGQAAGCWLLDAASCRGELLVSKFNLMPDKGLGHGSRGWAGQRSIA